MSKNEYFRETAAKIAEGIAASNSLNLATTTNVDKVVIISINVARKLTDYFDKEGHFTEAQ